MNLKCVFYGNRVQKYVNLDERIIQKIILIFFLNYSKDMEFIEVLTEGLEKTLMVRGGGREVITIYSWRRKIARLQLLAKQLQIRVSANLHKNCCCCLTLKLKQTMDALLVCCYIECYSSIFFTDFLVMFCVCVVLSSPQQLDQLELLRR